MAWRSGGNLRTGSRGDRPDTRRARQAQRRHLHGDDLSRTETKLRLQRRDLLVGGWNVRTARLRAAIGLYVAERSGCAGTADHSECAGEDAGQAGCVALRRPRWRKIAFANNPKGIASISPRLRETSHLGKSSEEIHSPNGAVAEVSRTPDR